MHSFGWIHLDDHQAVWLTCQHVRTVILAAGRCGSSQAHGCRMAYRCAHPPCVAVIPLAVCIGQGWWCLRGGKGGAAHSGCCCGVLLLHSAGALQLGQGSLVSHLQCIGSSCTERVCVCVCLSSACCLVCLGIWVCPDFRLRGGIVTRRHVSYSVSLSMEPQQRVCVQPAHLQRLWP